VAAFHTRHVSLAPVVAPMPSATMAFAAAD